MRRRAPTQRRDAGVRGWVRVAQAGRFSGILNGIDVEVWDPSVDPHIARQYSISDCTAGKLVSALSQVGELLSRNGGAALSQWRSCSLTLRHQVAAASALDAVYTPRRCFQGRTALASAWRGRRP